MGSVLRGPRRAGIRRGPAANGQRLFEGERSVPHLTGWVGRRAGRGRFVSSAGGPSSSRLSSAAPEGDDGYYV